MRLALTIFLLLTMGSLGEASLATKEEMPIKKFKAQKEKLGNFSESYLEKHGPTNLNRLLVGSLSVFRGSLQFNHLTVYKTAYIEGGINNSSYGDFGYLHVIGNVNAYYIAAKRLTIFGNATLKNFTISGNVHISGDLNARNGTLQNLYLKGKTIILRNVIADSIFIRSNLSDSKKGERPTLRLEGNTIINGDIRFEISEGAVEKVEGAKVLGNIFNSTVSDR